MKTSIILVAAGKGERFGQPKWQVRLAGRTLLEWCVQTLESLEFEKEIIVVSAEAIQGGETRHQSVMKGLKKATGDLIIIHNVANPLATVEDFQKVYELLVKEPVACFVGQKLNDTLRRVTEHGSETIDRTDMWRVQTPQGFRKESLMNILEANPDADPTDEVSLFEGSNVSVVGIETSFLNQKITYPRDLEMAEQLLRTEVLVGVGEDSHSFDTSGTMVLGGVTIDGLPKLQANSDGDLVLHAIFNAISSALGKRSLGITADPMVEQGILDSSEYLKVILESVRTQGLAIHNISISFECARPRIEPLVESLKKSLCELLGIEVHRIGITATSGETLSSFGKGEGIHCTCIVSLSRF